MSGLEPVAAFALACNVLQLIGAGFKTAAACKSIYETGQQDPELAQTDETLRQFLQSLDSSLQAATAPNKPQSQGATPVILTPDEKLLVKLASETRKAVEKLQGLEGKCLSAKGSRRASLLGAVKSMFKNLLGEVERQEKILQRQQATLTTGLLGRICTQGNALSIQQGKHFDELDASVRGFVSAISRGQTALADLLQAESAKTRVEVIQKMDELALSERDQAHRDRLLRSLKFKEMNHRRNQIQQQHDGTFAWALREFIDDTEDGSSDSDDDSSDSSSRDPDDDTSNGPPDALSGKDTDAPTGKAAERPPDTSSQKRKERFRKRNPFFEWLVDRAAGPLFWVNGKAGAGKSTLMKHIASSPITRKLLDQSRPDTLVLSHFFWVGGSLDERSVKGLFCSLLYRTLQVSMGLDDQSISRYHIWRHPIVEELLENRFDKDSPGDWSEQEVQAAFLSLVRALARPVCIFIDGLDEIDQNDGPRKLFSVCDLLLEENLIRLCVSSRPEPAFRKRFQNNLVPTLRVQDLTYGDIEKMVKDKLKKILFPGAPGSDYTDSMFVRVADALCEKASGVFLWVSLSIRAISKGADRGDTLGQLEQRLESLPEDLEDLYLHMWTRENGDSEVFRRDAALWLNLVLESRQPYSFRINAYHLRLVIDSERQTVDQILNSPAPLKEATLQLPKKMSTARRDVITRCAGLLEIRDFYQDEGNTHPGSIPYVNLIHRSAKDFLLHTTSGKNILKYDNTDIEERSMRFLKAALVVPFRPREPWQDYVSLQNLPFRFCEFVAELKGCDYIGEENGLSVLALASKACSNLEWKLGPCQFEIHTAYENFGNHIRHMLQDTTPHHHTFIRELAVPEFRNHLFHASFLGFLYRSYNREGAFYGEPEPRPTYWSSGIDLFLQNVITIDIHHRSLGYFDLLSTNTYYEDDHHGNIPLVMAQLGSPMSHILRCCPYFMDDRTARKHNYSATKRHNPLWHSTILSTLHYLVGRGADLNEKALIFVTVQAERDLPSRLSGDDFSSSSFSDKIGADPSDPGITLSTNISKWMSYGPEDKSCHFVMVEVNACFLLDHVLQYFFHSDGLEHHDPSYIALDQARNEVPLFFSVMACSHKGNQVEDRSRSHETSFLVAIASEQERCTLTRTILSLLQPSETEAEQLRILHGTMARIQWEHKTPYQLVRELGLVEKGLCVWRERPEYGYRSFE